MEYFIQDNKKISVTQRFSQWHLITYAEEKEFKPLLDYVKHYAYIKHDKDEVEPHTHILICGRSMSANAIKKRIQSEQNTRFETLKSKEGSFLYLTHENEEDKYHYEKSLIQCDDLEFWQKNSEETKEEKNEEFLNDLFILRKYQLAVKYGRDFMRYWKTYLEFAEAVKSEEEFYRDIEEKKENEKFLENI